jgi:nucleotide-binding universal stress UspA family protein
MDAPAATLTERLTATKPLKFSKILWATDFSPSSLASLPYVAAFSRRYQSRVYLAHVIVPHPYPLVSPEAVPYLDKLRQAASKHLSELSSSGQFDQIPHETLLGHGEVAEVLHGMIRDCEIDLVVVATHGRRGFRRSLLGSVAEEIWRTSTCPVLTVGPQVTRSAGAEIALRQILYPTDLSEQSLAAAPYALSFALEYSARLTVLHVVPSTIRASARLLTRAFRDEVREMIPAEAAPWCEPVCLVECGDPAETILRMAREGQADLIVLGVRSPRTLALQRAGNVAYRVVAEADCPVLTIQRVSVTRAEGKPM